RPNPGQVERLLALPIVKADLGLAVAVAGLLPGKRLARLTALLGEDAIVRALIADHRGFRLACLLPAETPAVELAWLAKVEATRPDRYVELAAVALGALAPPRVEG